MSHQEEPPDPDSQSHDLPPTPDPASLPPPAPPSAHQPPPDAFLKLIELDLERRRAALPLSNSRSIFAWRVFALLFLIGSFFFAWYLLDVASAARDRNRIPPPESAPPPTSLFPSTPPSP